MSRKQKQRIAAVTSDSESTPVLPKREKRMLAVIAIVAIITVLGALILGSYAAVNYKYERGFAGQEVPTAFTVPKGAGLSSIATRLEKDGLIDSAFIFKLVTKMRGNEANFKAGEFMIEPAQSMASVYETLAEGKAILYPFTAPEGLTSAQITRTLDAIPTLVDDNPSPPAEGTILPETYMTPRGMTQSQLLQKMALAQTQLLDELWDTRATDLPVKTRREAIILASVVEKETGVGMERGKVAGVFVNRLRKGMRLQSDPTIIYGVSRGEVLLNKAGKRRGIFRSEIDRRTDWNTYQIDGLPKTAICNPGADAIRAVLNPEETDALFFVADGTGGHAFSATLAGHERNVAKWRKIERERGQR